MNERSLDVLQHALGLDPHGRGREYRNHFVTNATGPDFDLCSRLASDGLMERSTYGGALVGGGVLFHVTDAGRRYVRENSPPAPKLTPGQRRYMEYLDADSGVNFIEWLRSRRASLR